ncbi:SGNH/GDSL hydrolase family protein [Janibacter sp. GXQ6167]|uniref:SGNH/GDSL hydrolase family protein n=1 Tax=Janibacter sp. GXQ6167 TaxID=3240791 RepID=UPI003525D732
MHGSRVIGSIAAAAVLLVAGCSGASNTATEGTSTPSPPPSSTSSSTSADPAAPLYLALGDSLAAGYQPRRGDDVETSYPARVRTGLAESVPTLQMVNLACSGERVGQMLDGGQCRYPEGNQVAAAEKVLAERSGPVDLITLDIGGNDLLRCAWPKIDQECARRGAEAVDERLPEILRRLRQAADSDTELVVLTYYNPFLALDDDGEPTALATATTPMIDRLNAAIRDAASAEGWRVVRMESVIPDAKAVCASTWRCAVGDIHLTDDGAKKVGDEILAQLAADSSR